MRESTMGWRFAGAARRTAVAVVLAVMGSQAAQAQFIFAPYQLVEDFETVPSTDAYLDIGEGTTIDINPGVPLNGVGTTHGVTRGARALQVETEGAFDLNDGEDFFGYGAIGGLAVRASYTTGAAYNAFQLAAQNPDKWTLVFDVSSDADSWAEAPATSTSVAIPGDIGPQRSGSRVALTYDGVNGTQFNTGSFYGTTGKLKVQVPFRNLLDGTNLPPITGATQWDLAFGADSNRFAPDDPLPNGGAKHYIDNVRLKPSTPQVPTILSDFEDGFDGWSDLGRSGVDTSHKHTIVTGANIGATQYDTASGKFLPTATGKGMLIDNSNITGNTFQWASTLAYNADTNNDGTVDAPAVKTQIQGIIGLLRKASSIQVDVTYHDMTNVPAALGTPVVPTDTNAGWLKLVLGVEMDSTPVDGALAGLQGNQYDNEFATDSLGNTVQTSQGNIAGPLTTEIQGASDGITPEEPLTFTYGISQIGSLITQLQSAVADNTNFLRFTFAVQGGDGTNGILAVIDNFRIVAPVSLDGDFDHDGDVDGQDLVPFKSGTGFGTSGNAASDADENGLTDGGDILVYQRNIGNDATPALAASGAVPEPASVVLVALGALGLAGARRRS